MKDIHIKQIEHEEPVFQVSLTDARGNKTRHRVTLSESYHNNLTHGKMSKLKLIEISFEFLLSKESSDAILSEFDVQDIMRYFPDYDRFVRNYGSTKK